MTATAASAVPASARATEGAAADFDLVRLRSSVDPQLAETMAGVLAGLDAEGRVDRLERLERGLLRLERISLETLAALQTIVAALKRTSTGDGER
jgi:hypothetical protein